MISYISHRRTVPGGESAQPITFLMLGERVAFSKKAGVRIFFWTILVVLTLSLSFLCILLDSCRPR